MDGLRNFGGVEHPNPPSIRHCLPANCFIFLLEIILLVKIFQYQGGKNFGTIPGRYMGTCGYNFKHSSVQYWVHVPPTLPPLSITRLGEPLRWSGRSGIEKMPTPATNETCHTSKLTHDLERNQSPNWNYIKNILSHYQM